MKKLYSMFVRVMATVTMAFLVVGNSRAQDSRLVTYREFGKEGFKNQKGEIIIPAVYDIAYPFGYAGLAKVKKYGKWGIVDQTGKEVISCNYEDVSISSDGLLGVKKDNQWGFYDRNGKEIVPLKYDYIDFFWNSKKEVSNGSILVKKADKWGIIDRSGIEVISPTFDDGKTLCNGLAVLKKDAKWGFVDRGGKEISSFQYNSVDQYFTAGIVIANKENKWGFIDSLGKEITPFEYDYLGNFAGDRIRVRIDKKWGFVDRNGQPVSAFEYDEARDFSKGTAWVKKVDKYGLIDSMGKEITPIEYKYFEAFSEGLARVQKDIRWGFIDQAGKAITGFDYDGAEDFSNGKALVRKGDKYGFLNRNGREIIPVVYAQAGTAYEGFLKVREDKKWHYFDSTGTLIKTSQYSDIKPYHEGMAAVCKEGKWGYTDESGKEIIKPRFFAASSFYDGVAIVAKSETKITLSTILDGLNSFAANMNNQMALNSAVFKSSYDRLLAEQSAQKEFQGDLERMNSGIKTAVYLGAINKQGEEVIPLNYLSVSLFKDNLYFVSDLDKGLLNSGLKYGIYDIEKGREIVPVKYTSLDVISLYKKNLVVVDMLRLKIAMVNYTEPNKGIVDYSGKEIVPAQYDILNINVFAPHDRILIGKILDRDFKSIFSPDNYTIKAAAYGVVDYLGKAIIPLTECDSIKLDDSNRFVVTFKDGSKKYYNLEGAISEK